MKDNVKVFKHGEGYFESKSIQKAHNQWLEKKRDDILEKYFTKEEERRYRAFVEEYLTPTFENLFEPKFAYDSEWRVTSRFKLNAKDMESVVRIQNVRVQHEMEYIKRYMNEHPSITSEELETLTEYLLIETKMLYDAIDLQRQRVSWDNKRLEDEEDEDEEF